MDRIGKVRIDDTYYPGEDFYCDGTIEDELLEIVQHNTPDQLEQIIEERGSWPIFYHLSKQRQNIVEWLPMDGKTKVLEVGSGCGAITGILAQKAGVVDCVELSKKRTLINANRNRTCDNVTIHIGNFKDIEPHLPNDYDYILLIGVFEYAKGYMGTSTPYKDFVKILKKHLKPSGRLVIAIENQFGLKYWAGCREDHVGTYFTGLEGYQEDRGVQTFTKRGLEEVLQKNHLEEYAFYYPYPDYKFMTWLYSDEYLPKQGELNANLCNYDRERMLLFDESLVYDTIIKEELFPLYSNSYMVIVGPKLPIQYCKYSNERKEEYEIRTDIILQDNEVRGVQKNPLTMVANQHIKEMVTSYELLTKRYEGSKIKFNKILDKTDSLLLEYIEGVSLESLFDECLQKGDQEGFVSLFQQYYEAISYNNGIEITNYDFIFSNILVQEDTWIVIDYEWIKREVVDARFIAYRGFYCYTLGNAYGKQLVKNQDKNQIESQIERILELTQEEIKELREQEVIFQKEITGERLTKGEMNHKIGNLVMRFSHMQSASHAKEMSIQIYEDYGEGYQEENSYFSQSSVVGGNTIVLEVESEVRSIRMDPCMVPCLVQILDLKWNGKSVPKLWKKLQTNGYLIANNQYLFQTTDPNIGISFRTLTKKERREKNRNQLEITYKLSCILET
ncbi:MAG: class I SAM-dependent methyltransferase [Eubacteriales bacterium]